MMLLFGFHASDNGGQENDACHGMPATARLEIIRDALMAICAGHWDDAGAALARQPQLTRTDAACLNLIGVVCLARHDWRRAKHYFGKAMRSDRAYAPAEQNMRRIYELETFGATHLPVGLVDHSTRAMIHQLRVSPLDDTAPLTQRISLSIRADATMDGVNRSWDWAGYLWAAGIVALATAIGWPLVHSRLHLSDTNVLMFYLLGVLWVATHFSRGAAVLASVLGVAVFDFMFVEPFYTFAVADQQYLVTFAVMLLTALVISTLTHRMRQQAELARQAWERVETEFLRNTLLSGVSHDLRTPLSAITGAAGSLLQADDALDRATRLELLETICAESDRMERLITNLLDMTRLESGGLVVKKEWLPLQEVIGSALHRLRNRLVGRDTKIAVSAQLPMISADGVLIEQVLINLIDNVIDYTSPDTPMEISASNGDGQITVEVSDRGPGLPAGTETRVFDKFFRISPRGRGIGLGLAIVRGIVEAHGGQVRAANRPGGGATFGFTLPAAGSAPRLDSSE